MNLSISKGLQNNLPNTKTRRAVGILLLVLLGPLNGRGQTNKDPKLCSLLRELRDSVAQGPISNPSEGVKSSVDLPGSPTKSIQDAMKGRVLRLNERGEVQVYIEVEQITPAYLETLRGLGITVQIVGEPSAHQSKTEVYFVVPTVEAMVPPSMLLALEHLPFVRYIRLPSYGISNSGSVTSQGDIALEAQATRKAFGVDGTGIRVGVISSGLAGIFASNCTSCGPTATSPSPITLGDLPVATGARQSGILTYVNDGTPVINGTPLSGVFTAQPFPNATGNLEVSITPIPDDAEGTAMLEIVYDLAPKATLAFANGESDMDFENAVNSLAAVSDVVVDDKLFLDPPYDGTSSVSTNTSDALNNNSNNIRAYITSVGNFALNHYQGNYEDSGVDGTSATGVTGDLHQFAPNSNITTDAISLGSATFDPVVVVPSGGTVSVFLGWNDPTGGSANDYDLFLVPLTCTGTPNQLPVLLPPPASPCKIAGMAVASSTNPQTGTQNPTESINWVNASSSPVSVGIAIQNVGNNAQPRTFDMFVRNPDGKGSVTNHNFNTVSGSVGSQSDAGGSPASVISVGAINASQCPASAPGNCTGLLEAFSSQGPTQSTPQGASRTKPDIIAVDGVCITGAGGFANPDTAGACTLSSSSPSYTPHLFGGTSAAAPHVAAIAALLLQAAPCLLSSSNSVAPSAARAELRNLLLNNAVALSGYPVPTPNNQVGYGLVDTYTSMMALLPSGIGTVGNAPSTGGSSTNSASATSANGASIEITGSASASTQISNCQPTAMQWSGGCGTGSLKALHTTITCPIGVNTVMVSVSYNGSSFLPLSQVAPFTVSVTDFLLGANPTTATAIQPGASALYVITGISTAQGTFANPITLACSAGLPPGAVCSFSAQTISAGTTPTSSTLTIYTSASAGLRSARNYSRSRMAPAVVSLVSPFGFMGLMALTGRRRKKLQRVLAVIAVIPFSACFVSCTTQKPQATMTAYTITISGTSNQLQRTTPISLTLE